VGLVAVSIGKGPSAAGNLATRWSPYASRHRPGCGWQLGGERRRWSLGPARSVKGRSGGGFSGRSEAGDAPYHGRTGDDRRALSAAEVPPSLRPCQMTGIPGTPLGATATSPSGRSGAGRSSLRSVVSMMSVGNEGVGPPGRPHQPDRNRVHCSPTRHVPISASGERERARRCFPSSRHEPSRSPVISPRM
jgi:hypothetical protein